MKEYEEKSKNNFIFNQIVLQRPNHSIKNNY